MEKKLKPSLRENKRYMLLQTNADRHYIETAILDFLGVLGYARASPKFIARDGMVLAVNREEIDNVKAALSLTRKQIIVKRVSGTLKGLRY